MLRRTDSVERHFVKLVAHASPSILEAELLDRVAAAKSPDPLAAVLIVVPSRRLADHVNHRLVERFGAILGVSVLHHRALAERVLDAAGARPRQVLGEALIASLFTRVVHRAPAGRLRDFVRDHPGAASAMLKALTDLREAGIEPATARETLSGQEADTAALYTRWSDALNELTAQGEATDDAGLVCAAIPHAEAFASRFSTIVHHGAYDLIGVGVELVRALDRGCELTFLLPADPVDASGAFGVRRAQAIAASRDEPGRVARELPAARVTFLHAQGARAELQSAAYAALAAVAGGTPPREVAIVVRGFRPYLAAMDALLDAGGLRWHTSYTRPLRRDPRVGRALRAIAAGADTGPLPWTGHADAFEAIAREAEADAPLQTLFQSMRGVETLLGDGRALPRGEAVGWLEARIDAAKSPAEGGEGRGVRILDVMQARGLTFSHVELVGMNAGIFPYVALEHPFLADDSRVRLRELTGRPLPIAGERDGEEHLLLAMLLRSTRDHVNVSWRRADESARPLVPSLALRELARFAGFGSEAADAERAARALPAHPSARLEAWAASPGLLDRRDETLLTALSSESGADAGPAVAARRPEWADGIGLVAATEAFDRSPGPYDGRIGVSVLREVIAATALERLGRCPLQFFFRDVLRIPAVRRRPTPFSSDPASIGLRVHDVLREIYGRLGAEGAFTARDPGARLVRARALLREAWSAHGDADIAARAARFPVLDRIETGIWMRTLDVFLAVDLKRMSEQGLTPESLERDVGGAIPGGPAGLTVEARFDRVLSGDGVRIVGDYKTGGVLAARVKSGAMLTGASLQVPIYALLSGAPVELLGVGPRHDADAVRFQGFKSTEERDGVLETLSVAAALAAAGRFPIHPAEHCAWCDYRSACRHGHPPTLFRESNAKDVRDARDCWSKTAKTPTIAAVRGEAP
jgi:RecB family exonuclease